MGARPDQEAARALASMRWRSPSSQRRIVRQETRLVTGPAGSRWLASSFIPNGPADSPSLPGFSHTVRLRPPAPRSSCAYRCATLFSRSRAAQPWSGAVIGGPGPTACLTTGPPVVCSSGRRRLPSAVPITGARRLRLAVRGPVEQLGVLATLSRWRSRVQIPSGPQGSPVRFHWGPSQVR